MEGNKKSFWGILFVVLAIILIIMLSFVYFKGKPSPQQIENEDWKKISETADLSVEVPVITTGSIKEVSLLRNNIKDLGFPVKESYKSFNDLITDIKSKNDERVKILGTIRIGGVDGYEVKMGDNCGGWAVKDGVLYEYYFGKPGPLSETDKLTLETLPIIPVQ